MVFYKSIANYYQFIFPLNPIQVEFTKQLTPLPETETLLDVGCGIGSLSYELSKHFNRVHAIDADAGMIEKAKELTYRNNCIFHKMDMLRAELKFGRNSFNRIICYGNTLVHLALEDEVLDFFVSVKNMLRKNGSFAFQIINYDRIIKQNINFLPTIENEHIKFVRKYNLLLSQKKIEFETILTVNETSEIIKNKVNLLALGNEKIKELLNIAGFKRINFSGSFKKDDFTPNSVPLIVVAR